MTTELQTKESQNALSPNYEKTALEYLTSMGLKLPEKHQKMFLELSKSFGLNPFKREIYAVGYGENFNIITGYEVYLKRAERTGLLNGVEVEFSNEDNFEKMTCTCIIYRKDWTHPFKHTVRFKEFAKFKNGQLASTWAQMPTFMLEKVCRAQSYRMCFPDEMSGMPYISEEIVQEEINITPQPQQSTIDSKPQKRPYTYTEQEIKIATENVIPQLSQENCNTLRGMWELLPFADWRMKAIELIDEQKGNQQ